MTKEKTIGIVLSGAGFLDGSEIQETVIALLALDEAGVATKCFAPNVLHKVVDHVTGADTAEERNVLKEAARISRGKITDLAKAKANDVDGWIFPGGYGAVKILSNFAFKGVNAEASSDVVRIINESLESKIPLGACCIAPATLAAATRGKQYNLSLTIGEDADTAKAIEHMGANHINCPVTEYIVDEKNHVVTCPAYMFDAKIGDVAKGIRKMVNKVVEWTRCG